MFLFFHVDRIPLATATSHDFFFVPVLHAFLRGEDGLQRQLPQVCSGLPSRSGASAPAARELGGSRGVVLDARQQHPRQEGAVPQPCVLHIYLVL